MSIKKTYLGSIKGLPMKKRIGHNTRKGAPRNHVYKVEIYGHKYFKVQLHRTSLNITKYFKKKKHANLYIKLLKTVQKWK